MAIDCIDMVSNDFRVSVGASVSEISSHLWSEVKHILSEHRKDIPNYMGKDSGNVISTGLIPVK